MHPHISIITLGVKSVEASMKFYCEGLGWESVPRGGEEICFIKLNGILLALYPKDKLAEDAGQPMSKSTQVADGGFSGVTLAHNVSSEEEVSQLIAKAEDLGAKILRPAEKVFWGGFRGYFADPDGYPWEVAYNPYWEIDANGSLKVE